MARSLRIEYEGACYHVMCRGNRGVRVFGSQDDVRLWLDTLGDACERSGLIVHTYCLMSTHYHLLLETPRANLVEGMKWLQGAFTRRYHALHGTWGHLFQGRYKAKVVDHDSAYFSTAGIYILLNPVSAGIINLQQQNLKAYLWSSYPAQVGASSKRPDWLQTERLLQSCGIAKDSTAGRRAFAAYVKVRGLSVQLKQMDPKEKQEWAKMERGWIHGSTEFRKTMIDLLREDGGVKHRAPLPGEQRRDISRSSAELAFQKGLRALEQSRRDLQFLRKGDPRKLMLAGWLRFHFQVSASWVADIVGLGHPSTSTRALNFYRKPPKEWQRAKWNLLNIL